QVKDNRLSFYAPLCPSKSPKEEKVSVKIGIITSFLSKKYKISSYNAQEMKEIKENDKNYLNYCIDCDKIGDKLFLRTRQENDRFSFTKRNVTKTIKKLLIEDKVPRQQRDDIAILSDEKDNVLWLEGYGVNRPFAITQKSKSILIIEKE
ncbi:MAG: tRNA lysidine(34) synthetase TilS, partial [Oscillospiraceae bacterium]